jgi:hypothetical protein
MSGNLYRRPLFLVLIITEHCTIIFTIILTSTKNRKKYLDKYNNIHLSAVPCFDLSR